MIAVPVLISRRIDMTEQNKPVVSFPGKASDIGENISGDAGKGNEGDTASSKNGEGFLTEAQFDSKMDAFEKKFQSRTDKATASKLKPLRQQISDINESHKQLMESGVDLTDAQKATLEKKRTDAIDAAAEKVDSTVLPDNDLIQKPTPTDDGSGKGEAESEAAVKVDPIVAAATKIMDEVGARIYEDDPEAKLLKESRDTSEYLANAKVAATQKAARLARDPASLGMKGGASETGIMDMSDSAAWDEISKTI